MSETTIAGKLTREYAAKFPTASTRQLARMLAANEPKLFSGYEAARAALRWHRGIKTNGDGRQTGRPITMVNEYLDKAKDILRRRPSTLVELADALKCPPKDATRTVEELRARGTMIGQSPDQRWYIHGSESLDVNKHQLVGDKGEWTYRFGITTDNHLCNRNSRLDVLYAAYNYFAAQGIKHVFNCGNWIDGEFRYNRNELVTAPGLDNQCDYLIDKWPQHKGIVTKYIAGDDHEGWYQQREGIEIGKHLQLRAAEQGRHDLEYLGYAECDVVLKNKKGSAILRVVHPGGGSAYAISYSDQKRVESYQGGNKPQIEFVGHYHKFNYGYPREVHTFQCGTTCDQTLFMRKKKLQAHVGFQVVSIKQGDGGEILQTMLDWHPFYDVGYYEKRFV